MKKILTFLIVGLLMILSACGSSSTGTESDTNTGGDGSTEELEPITIRLGHVGPEKSVVDYAAHYFKDTIYEKTDGKITVDIYPGGQLGGDRDMIESVSGGSLSMAIPGVTTLSNFTPAFTGIPIPFLIDDGEIEEQLYKSDLFQVEAMAELENINIKGLGFVDQGFQEVGSAATPFDTLENVQGESTRTSENTIIVDAFEQLGMAPTSIPYQDMYSALETGVINSGAIPIASWEASGMTEIINHLTIANAIAAPHLLLINLDEFNNYPKEYQDALIETGLETQEYIFGFETQFNNEAIDRIKELGVNVFEMEKAERDKFVERLQPVYEKYAEQEPWIKRTVELIEELRNSN